MRLQAVTGSSDKTVHKPQQLVPSPVSAKLVLAKAVDFPNRTFFHWKLSFVVAMLVRDVILSFLNQQNCKNALI